MKQKFIKINGVDFELCKWRGNAPTWQSVKNADMRYMSIYDAYDKPSTHKENIWCYWVYWFGEISGRCWVSSRNCNFFTIHGFCEWENKRYWIEITARHNRAWEVE